MSGTSGETDEITRRSLLTRAAMAGAAVALVRLADGCSSAKNDVSSASLPPMSNAATVPVTLSINGKDHAMQLEPRVTLLDALRENLQMYGTKKGCDHGQCGACTVLIDDRRVNSCLLLACAQQGKQITTVEGLEKDGQLHPVQAAFIEHDGFQCGYCTPGQLCSAVGMIKEGHAKSDDDIREQMSGNICRCGAYPNIVAAIREAMTRPA